VVVNGSYFAETLPLRQSEGKGFVAEIFNVKSTTNPRESLLVRPLNMTVMETAWLQSPASWATTMCL
jgi:hypothetical protein